MLGYIKVHRRVFMDLHYLKLFNILASELSFSKAANMLYISQPAVSIQIKKLENDLGLKLFDKAGKNLYLNDNGKLLYEYTKKIFELIEEAESSLFNRNEIVRGTINIGASNTPGTYILPKILGEFKEIYPYVETNLHIANTFEVERMVLDNKVDFAINGGDISYGNSLYVEKLAEDEVMLVSSPTSKLVEMSSVGVSDMAGCSYIAHEKNSQLYKFMINMLSELGLFANITMTLGNIEAIKQAVSANLGISAIPGSAMRIELKYGLLKQLNINGKKWSYPYNLIYYKNRQLTYGTVKLIELIRKRISDFC